MKETKEGEAKKKKEDIKDDYLDMLNNEQAQDCQTWSEVEEKLKSMKEFESAPDESRKEWYLDYLKTRDFEGDEAAQKALKEYEKNEKQQRMEEAIEKRKRQAEEQRGALGRQLDSERRKHQAGNSR